MLEPIPLTENDTRSQYSRFCEPIEISVEIDIPTTLIYIYGPISICEPIDNGCNVSITFHFDTTKSEGLRVKSKKFQMSDRKIGELFELLRNHPERVEQWCAENSDTL